jgi:hypothetical protein
MRYQRDNHVFARSKEAAQASLLEAARKNPHLYSQLSRALGMIRQQERNLGVRKDTVRASLHDQTIVDHFCAIIDVITQELEERMAS